MFIINIELSPFPGKLFRVYLSDGTWCDFGSKHKDFYVLHHDRKKRNRDLSLLTREEIQIIKTMRPSQLLYETFILNGYSRDIIKNINFFNQQIL